MESTIEKVRELGNNVVQISERIKGLEKDSAFMTDSLVENEEKLQSRIQKKNEQITKLHETIDFIKTQLKNTRIELDILIGTLKDTALQRQVDLLRERIDEWAPDKLITKNDLREYFEDY